MGTRQEILAILKRGIDISEATLDEERSMTGKNAISLDVEGLLVEAVDSGAVTGAAVEVRRHGETLVRRSAGRVEDAAVTDDSVWWVASLTKPVVAAATLIAVESGALRLDDPVERYVPEFAGPRRVRRIRPGAQPTDPPIVDDDVLSAAAEPLTVRHFLTGTSGLQTLGVPNAAVPAPQWGQTLGDFVPLLATAPLDFVPGSRWHYSNATGSEVLARCVEVAVGMPFARFVAARILDPLGMRSTSFGVVERTRERTLPLGFAAGNPIMGDTFASGSAGLLTTLDDYSDFAEMLLQGGRRGDARILAPESVAELSRQQIGELRLPGIDPADYAPLFGRPDADLGFGYGVLTILGPTRRTAVPAGGFGWDGMGSRRFWVVPAWDAVIVVLSEGPGAVALQRDVERAVAAHV
jgi:CubicO group peptidase (beta-lactamase class C family)